MGTKIAAIGMFDGVHCGHRAMLESVVGQARLRNLVPIAVTFSRHPLEVVAPGRAPGLLMPASMRIEEIRSCGIQEVVVLDFDDELRRLTAREFMRRLRDSYGVKVIYMGYNHRFGSDGLDSIEAYRDQASSLGMEILRGDEVTAACGKVSSSRIRGMLMDGDVAGAAVALGRNYTVGGKVVHGKRLGRKLGFPTANICIEEPRQLVPAPGVYACMVIMPDGSRYKAMVNVGCRPTVDADGGVSIEAHLLDYSGNLYGSHIRVDFVARMRDEVRFPSIDDLQKQLKADEILARRILQD